MKNYIDAAGELRIKIPVNFNSNSAKKLNQAVVEVLHFIHEMENDHPAITAFALQLVPFVFEHIEISASSHSWKIARRHFVEASAQLANIISILQAELMENL